MTTVGHFHVQTRLVEILGGLCRSSEEALKELVANSWDADATRVDVLLPLALTAQPIVVRDNGCGMTRQELEAHYLAVAVDRRRIWGASTPKGRRVRGHLGIGRFAGFVAADRIVVTTVAWGTRSRLVLDKKYLQERDEDLESVSLPIETAPCDSASGTVVELSILRPGFEQPSPKKLGSILLREFGVSDDFAIFVDDVRLTPDVLEGKKVQLELSLPDNAKAEVTAWFLSRERAVTDTGFVLRVGDRMVGPASDYGLDQDPELSRSALRRMYVEVRADHL